MEIAVRNLSVSLFNSPPKKMYNNITTNQMPDVRTLGENMLLLEHMKLMIRIDRNKIREKYIVDNFG